MLFIYFSKPFDIGEPVFIALFGSYARLESKVPCSFQSYISLKFICFIMEEEGSPTRIS